MHYCGNPFHDFFANLVTFLPFLGTLGVTAAAVWSRLRRGRGA